MSKAEELVKKLLHEHSLDLVYNWLSTTDFFTAPASSNWHGCYSGGLVDHSLTVYYLLKDWTKKLELDWDEERSPVIVGLLHDVCKIDCYEQYTDEHGKLRYKSTSSNNEHGLRSVRLLENEVGLTLTDEERACIKYHMGTFTKDIDVDLGDLSYSEIITKYPNVLWMHTADMYASQIYKR